MTPLSPSQEAIIDRAAAGLSAWHVLETLAAAGERGCDTHWIMRETGFDVDASRRATEQLIEAGLVTATRGGYKLAPGQARDVAAVMSLVARDAGLRRGVMKLAALRECGVDQLDRSVAAGSPWTRVSAPPTPRSIAASVRAVPGPTRSTGRGAPAA